MKIKNGNEIKYKDIIYLWLLLFISVVLPVSPEQLTKVSGLKHTVCLLLMIDLPATES